MVVRHHNIHNNNGWFLENENKHKCENPYCDYTNKSVICFAEECMDGEREFSTQYSTVAGKFVHKADLSYLTEKELKKLNHLLDLENHFINGAYILEYSMGSFAELHSDDPDQADKTSVTMIDTSEDLSGGFAILFDRVGAPVVVEQKKGETLWYDTNIKHCVSTVFKGTRRVLITWWKKHVAIGQCLCGQIHGKKYA